MTAGGLLYKLAGDNSGVGPVATGAVLVGATSLLASSHSIARHRQIARAERESVEQKRVAEASLMPMLSGSVGHPALGATLSFRF